MAGPAEHRAQDKPIRSLRNLLWPLSQRYPRPSSIPKGKMISERPSSVAERRLSIARRLYNALVAALPNRAITLSDGRGRVIASSQPDPDAEDNSR
jgi:hypothetical protein